MSIGYACLAVGVWDTEMKHCMMKNAHQQRLMELISINLKALHRLIDYNIENDIKLFRISSDLIPFGSSPVNDLDWWDLFAAEFCGIGEKIRQSGIRVSMHPGQYTVLNSPHEDVVKRSIWDLIYHARVLDSLGTSPANKVILHVGGVYNDKEQAIERFYQNYQQLPDIVKRRLVIENDDKSYNIGDVLEIGKNLGIPVVYDNLHNLLNRYDAGKTDKYWITECGGLWQEKDGPQKIHYSQQNYQKKPGSHSDTIKIKEFMEFYNNIKKDNLNIMLEVKDKNLSAIKCINCTSNNKKIKSLEDEWSHYKYSVLEKSPEGYIEIRELLKNKRAYPSVAFYGIIEEALSQTENIGHFVNAAQHVWGYFKDKATTLEKEAFVKNIERYQLGQIGIKSIKKSLWKMAVEYQQQYLLNSYYFVL